MIDMHADKFHTYQYLWTNKRKKPPKQLTITSNVKSELCIVQLLTTKIVLFWQKHETLPGSSVFYLVSRAFVAIVQRKPAQVAAQRMEAGGGGASAGLPVEWRVPDWGIGAWTVAMETDAKKTDELRERRGVFHLQKNPENFHREFPFGKNAFHLSQVPFVHRPLYVA